ncbi:hypothetical protein ACWDCO_24245 [Streptomyces albogriseolus]
MNPIRPLGPAVRTEVTADLNGLPHGRITEQGNEARVILAGLDELTDWFTALGGRITCEPAPHDSGVCLWTLHTHTERTHGTPIRVHALALDTDQIDPDCADAVA